MKLNRLAIALSGIGFLSVTGASFAQDATPTQKPEKEETIHRVEITGSNIKRVDAETASPVQIISRIELTRGGATSLSEVLKTISSNIGGVSENNPNGFSAGAQGLNLRGMGSQATLVLINGRRLAAYAQPEFNSTFVDLNSIPVGAVERIEILKDGASAIYGSEAMAGVVNIILRSNFEGGELSGSYGVSQRNDGQQNRASLSFGKGNLVEDHFNVYGTLDVRQRKPMFLSNRDDYLSTKDLTAWGYKDGRSIYSSPGNIYWTDKTTGKFVSRPIAGTCAPDRLVPGSVIFGANAAPGSTACVFDDYKDGTYNSAGKSDRIGLTSRATWQISEDTTVFAELLLNQNKAVVTGNLQWVAANNGGEFPALPITHPQYPKELIDPVTGKTLAGGNGTVRVRAQLGDFPGQGQDNVTDFGRYLVGIKGVIGNWDWESALMANTSKVDSKASSGILATPFLNAYLDGTFIFGGAAKNADLYNKITTNSASNFKSAMYLWDGKLSGELMQLPAGPLAAAFGTELRHESLQVDPDPLSVEGELYHWAQSPPGYKAARNVFSVYSELSVPVLKNLEAQVAARYDHYSDYGNSTTPKLGLKWTISPSFLVRGTLATGFRAPTLVENGSGIKHAYMPFKDPFRCNDKFTLGCQDESPYESGANPNLKPETAKSFTLGIVFEPTTWLSGSLDAWQIQRKNEISTYSLTSVLANPDRFANNPAAVITRDPLTPADQAAGATAGQITNIRMLLTNVALTDLRGLDLNLKGKFNFGEYGTLNPKLDLSYTQSYKYKPSEEETAIEYASTRNLPKVQATLGAGWRKAAWEASADIVYIGKQAMVEDYSVECVFKTQGYENLCRDIPSFTTLNFGAAYSGLAKNLRLSIAVQNAFDRKPPFAPEPSGGVSYASLHDPMGRYFQVTLDYKFR